MEETNYDVTLEGTEETGVTEVKSGSGLGKVIVGLGALLLDNLTYQHKLFHCHRVNLHFRPHLILGCCRKLEGVSQ